MATTVGQYCINVTDLERSEPIGCVEVHHRAVDAGFESTMPPTRLDRWPVTVAFILDLDGYLIELVQRHER